MACKRAPWIKAKQRRGRNQQMKASTQEKDVELGAAMKSQTLEDIPLENQQDQGDGGQYHYKRSDDTPLITFLRTFRFKADAYEDSRDYPIFSSQGVVNDTEVRHGRRPVLKKTQTQNDGAKSGKPQSKSHDKNDAGNIETNFREATSLLALLKVVTKQRDLQKGSSIHTDIVNRGLLKQNVFLGSALVNMYGKCGALEKAQAVFDELATRNAVSWNALIAGYAQHGHGKKALACLDHMQRAGLSPDAMTYACVLKACGSIKAIEKGNEVHLRIVERGLLRTSVVLGNALVDMYVKCGAMKKAQEVFNELPSRNTVSWTTLIAGYCQHGQGEKALDCFKHMQREGLSPDAVTLRCILKACSSIGAADKGKEVHAEIARDGLLIKDSTIGSALVDMYAKCGALAAAQEVFDELPVQDIVSWTALIAGYAQHGKGERALHCLAEMKGEGLLPNAVTLLCVLKACCSIGAAEKGQTIHAEAIREGFFGRDCIFGNALVDMYAKCGVLSKSYHVFNELPVRTVVSWTALIAGYGQVGKHVFVFDLFNRMRGEGIDPNSVTFLVVLNSFNHLGLVKEGQMYFEMMSKNYGLVPDLHHCSCMVDLYGRSGHFDKALTLIKRMPSSNHLTVWFVFLTACQRWGNVALGKSAFNQLIWLDGKPALRGA